ncbi:MAG: hypothetical protein HQ498_01070 [Pseudohongiella sp.]|nr:hypothetical protein [Pseudohongiella sp.]
MASREDHSSIIAKADIEVRDRFEALKLEKFRKLVRHANQKAPYYTRLIKQRGINVETCTPADFPVLTKAMLMANFDDIVTDPRLSKQLVADFLTQSSDPKDLLFKQYTVMHTSGTSGEVGYFLTKAADQRRSFSGMLRQRKTMNRGARRWPIKGIRRLRMAFYGATGGHYAGVTMVARMQRGIARLLLKAEAFEVNSPLPSIVDQLNVFQPDFLFGYTTALKILGEQQRQGILNITPVTIAATGEMVTKEDVKFLSESFGAVPVHNIYACTEHMSMGFANPDHQTMTLTDSNLIFEFFDDHSIVTNLYNYTMPLIRYRMSDILRPVSSKGAHPIVIESLVGRCEQMPAFINSRGETDFISPHTINEIFVKGVTRFQMQIIGETSFRFPICVETTLSSEERSTAVIAVEQRLREILLQKGLSNVTFEVPIVEEIPLNQRTRKFQLIVDNKSQMDSE